jgi:hypothetical protein
MDSELADLVARDLERFAEKARVTGAVFAVALWVDDGSGAWDGTPEYGVSVGADADLDPLRRAPVHQAIPDDHWYGWPTSERWNSGNWSHVAEDFITPSTKQALRPLSDQIRAEAGDHGDGECDLEWPCSCQASGFTRWLGIAAAAATRVRLPASVPATSDVVMYVEGPDLQPVQRALAMLRTVPAPLFHAIFPVWRRLAQVIRDTPAESPALAGQTSSELAELLIACGLQPSDVATQSRQLHLALHVAATGVPDQA